MAVVFVLGFFLDAIEIIFLVVPIAMPPTRTKPMEFRAAAPAPVTSVRGK